MGPEQREALRLGRGEVVRLEDARQDGGRHHLVLAEGAQPADRLDRRVVVDPLVRVGHRVRDLALDGHAAPVPQPDHQVRLAAAEVHLRAELARAGRLLQRPDRARRAGTWANPAATRAPATAPSWPSLASLRRRVRIRSVAISVAVASTAAWRSCLAGLAPLADPGEAAAVQGAQHAVDDAGSRPRGRRAGAPGPGWCGDHPQVVGGDGRPGGEAQRLQQVLGGGHLERPLAQLGQVHRQLDQLVGRVQVVVDVGEVLVEGLLLALVPEALHRRRDLALQVVGAPARGRQEGGVHPAPAAGRKGSGMHSRSISRGSNLVRPPA